MTARAARRAYLVARLRAVRAHDPPPAIRRARAGVQGPDHHAQPAATARRAAQAVERMLLKDHGERPTAGELVKVRTCRRPSPTGCTSPRSRSRAASSRPSAAACAASARGMASPGDQTHAALREPPSYAPHERHSPGPCECRRRPEPEIKNRSSFRLRVRVRYHRFVPKLRNVMVVMLLTSVFMCRTLRSTPTGRSASPWRRTEWAILGARRHLRLHIDPEDSVCLFSGIEPGQHQAAARPQIPADGALVSAWGGPDDGWTGPRMSTASIATTPAPWFAVASDREGAHCGSRQATPCTTGWSSSLRPTVRIFCR